MPSLWQEGIPIMALSAAERQEIADEIIRRVDTVTLLTCEEVRNIWSLAQ